MLRHQRIAKDGEKGAENHPFINVYIRILLKKTLKLFELHNLLNMHTNKYNLSLSLNTKVSQ